MSNQPLAPEDVRAAAGAHHELGAPYSDAVIESFLERIDQKIDARLDARLGQHLGGGRTARRSRLWWRQETPAERGTRHTLLTGAVIGAASTGVPATLFLIHYSHMSGDPVRGPLIFIWLFGGVASVGLSRLVSRLWRRSAPGGPGRRP
jgi:hypothetical protein